MIEAAASTPMDRLRRLEADAIVERLRPLVSARRQARIEEVVRSRTRDLTLVMEEIYSDHNNAAILRTADIFGLLDVHHVSATAELRLSRRVALGSEKWLNLVGHPGPEAAFSALRGRGYEVWAAAVHGRSIDVDALPSDRPLALVFGNELEGLSAAAQRGADGCFRLPMRGFAESFNVSVAAALTLDRVLRRRPPAPLPVEEQAKLRACYHARSVRAAQQLLAEVDLPFPVLATADTEWVER
jgi:tRNA (guanosine-2'-O-)-methyltransferase